MKRKFWTRFAQHVFFVYGMLIGSLWIVSCEDQYSYDNTEPDWLGASIYDYLKTDGHFTNYTQLIDDVGYRDVLQKTGSKTLFVANDSAFNIFFQNNPWGVSSYSGLSLAQKRLILNFGMINNAYLIETLSNYNITGGEAGLILGASMRRETAISVYDSLPFEKGNEIPDGSLWQPYKTKGINLLKDETSWPIVYFLQNQLENAKITNEDFAAITGVTRSFNDAHIFGKKVVIRDITCKNGYINVLENVLIPPKNMADYIKNSPGTNIFSSLLHRYCAPYYYPQGTLDYKKLHPGFNDTVFVKQFFTVNGGGGQNYYPDGITPINPNILLPFDPGWNSYFYQSSSGYTPFPSDMAAMFAPTDDAMNNYFNIGAGTILKERYGSWDKVPDKIVTLLLKRHMMRSFIESVPSRFNDMQDNEGFPILVKKSDIVSSYIGINGLVYLCNSIYPPPDFESVYAPVLFSAKTKIFDYVISYKDPSFKTDYRMYLNSLENRFSLFVPTDVFFTNCIDPLTIGKDVPGALKYWYNEANGRINATVYKYNVLTNQIGDSVNVITDIPFLINRLYDILNSHIVIDNVESGKKYYLTKNENIIKINGAGLGLTAQGGMDIENGQKTNVVDFFMQRNGNTYFIDKPIQTPIRSLYKVLSTTPEFGEFFSLCNGAFPPTSAIFVKKSGSYGIDFNVRFFNTFNYTVYVPTDSAIQDAILKGIIIPWESQPGITGIDALTGAQKTAAITKLERFVRYHFQDNSVFAASNSNTSPKVFSTATIKTDDAVTTHHTFRNKYYKIGVRDSLDYIVLTTETNGRAKVIVKDGLYNILVRDYIFKADPRSYKEIDGSGSGTFEYNTSQISTSSTAVIHQIDKVLLFQ